MPPALTAIATNEFQSAPAVRPREKPLARERLPLAHGFQSAPAVRPREKVLRDGCDTPRLVVSIRSRGQAAGEVVSAFSEMASPSCFNPLPRSGRGRSGGAEGH